MPTAPVQIVGATPGTTLVPSGEPFPAQTAALDAALRADGWLPQPATSSVTAVVDDYWVKLAGQPSGTLGDRDYSAGDLPSAGYAKTVHTSAAPDGERELMLEVSWVDAGSQDTVLTGYGGWTTLTRHGAAASAPTSWPRCRPAGTGSC
jgi:hypothetical protein